MAGLFNDYNLSPTFSPGTPTRKLRPVKKGYAGGGSVEIKPGDPGGLPGYGGVLFAKTKGDTDWEGMPSMRGGPQEKEYYRPKTDAERTALKLKQGIAPTAQNMGSLAVQSRADEETAREGGGQSIGDVRAQKVIDTRRDDRIKRRSDRWRAIDAFRARYRDARKEWAATKGRNPGGGASRSHGQRSNSIGSVSRGPSVGGLSGASASYKNYGLFD